MNTKSCEFKIQWFGHGVLAKAVLFYLRNLPDHPCKRRLFRILAYCALKHGVSLRDKRGTRIIVDPLDCIGSTICFQGAWEPLSLSLAERLMTNGGTFLDIGANFGLYTCFLAELPGVKCIAVDASASAIVKLQDNLGLNPRVSVTVVNTALGSLRSFVRLANCDPTNLGKTKVLSTLKTNAGRSHIVGSARLSDLLTDLNSGIIQLMKIDVEGSEFEVFRGMDFSAHYRPRNIIMEYSEEVTANPGDLRSCISLLCENGYRPFTVSGEEFNASKPLPEDNLWWQTPS